jgi:predicted nucleic acid-binding protein
VQSNADRPNLFQLERCFLANEFSLVPRYVNRSGGIDGFHVVLLVIGLLLDKPKGKKRERLEAWFAGPEGPQSLFKGRILPFDEKAALVWARLMSEGRAAGKPRGDLDMIVAAVAETNECVIVTDNEKHFSGLDVLNPLRTSR